MNNTASIIQTVPKVEAARPPSAAAKALRDEKRDHDPQQALDDVLLGSSEGIQTVKLSLLGLAATALLQLGVVLLSGSVGLLSDMVHNLADASTALPLWIAFALARRPANRRYTYGYGRAEDLAGIFIVVMIVASAAFAAWESVARLLHPQPVGALGWVAVAGLVGFLGNWLVAQYRISAGKRIGSAALVADGYHARTDSLTSLAVVAGAAGVWLGVPHADPIVGLVITLLILVMLKDVVVQIWQRLMDAIDPEVLDSVEGTMRSVPGVRSVSAVRARWIGHRIDAEALIEVDSDLSLIEAHAVSEQARHAVLQAVPKFANLTVQTDPIVRDRPDPRAELAQHDRSSARAVDGPASTQGPEGKHSMWLVRRLTPLISWGINMLLHLGVSFTIFGPMRLLTVRGRQTGKPRTVPVDLNQSNGRYFLIATHGLGSWVYNLRAARSGILSLGHRRQTFTAVELTPEEAGPVIKDVYGPLLASPGVRGATLRQNIGVLRDASEAEFLDAARRHPVFEIWLNNQPS
jgi:deazaflavin-dependent oxidoreductase (nitroreductase family)